MVLMAKERENNNNRINADEIKFDDDVIGALSSKNDIDVFKIYIDKAMLVYFFLDPPIPSVSNSWDIVIRNSEDEIFTSKINMRGSRPDRDGEYLITQITEPGYYYIYITQNGITPINQDYSFSLKSYDGYYPQEVEANNSFSDAIEIYYDKNNLKYLNNYNFSSFDQEDLWIRGQLYLTEENFSSNYDKDFYRFNLQNEYDTINLSFKTPFEHWSNSPQIYDTDGDKWIVEFYHEDDLNTPVGEKTFPALSTNGAEYEFSVKKAGIYFIKIYQDNFKLVDSSNYEFKLNFSLLGTKFTAEDPLDGTNIIVPSGNDSEQAFWIGGVYDGKQGDDFYILSNAISTSFTISDKLGDNIIQFVDGFSIISSKIYSNVLELNFKNNIKITIENANLFTYEIGGNKTAGATGTKLSYLNFVKELGANSIPAENSSKDGSGFTVSRSKSEGSNPSNDSNNSSNEISYSDKDVTFFTDKFFEEFVDSKWNFGKNIVTISYSFPTDSLRESNNNNYSTKLIRQFTDLEKKTIEESINLWDSELDTIQFKFVEDDKFADITFGITYIDGKGNTSGSFARTSNNRKIKSTIIRLEDDDFKGTEELKKLSLHEIGNALGLGDIRRTSDFESVMFEGFQGGYSDNFVLSNFDKAMIKAYYRENTIESYSGTTNDDKKILSSGDNIWVVGPGYDQVDGGSGIDTVVIPDDARIVRATDVKGEDRYTGIEGKNFLTIRLKDKDGDVSNEYSVLWNFEKIEYRDKTFEIKSFDDNGYYNLSSDWKIIDYKFGDGGSGEEAFDLSDYFYTKNEGANLSYTISSTNDDLKDQILLENGILTLNSGAEGENLTTEITITVKETSNLLDKGFVDDITETFKVTMQDNKAPISYSVSKNSDSVNEGNLTTYTITGSSISDTDVTFTYEVKGDDNQGTVDKAISSDFEATNGKVTIAAGEKAKIFNIKVINDDIAEGIEGFKVSIFDSSLKEIYSSINLINNVSENIQENDYFDDAKNSNGPNIIEFSTSSSANGGTLNYTSQNDIIVHTGQADALRGLAGDDVYILSSLIPKGFSGSIVDTTGSNVIEITDNTLISKIEFAADAFRITIDQDKVLIINGADNLSYRLGSNLLNGDTSEDLNYSQFSSIFTDYFTGESYVKSNSLGTSDFNIINISDKNSEIIKATVSNDDFRYRFEQTSSVAISLENFINTSIEGFDKNNDKITLVNFNGNNLSINEFKSLNGIDISGNSFDNNTVIYFSPDGAGASGSLEIAGIYDTDFEDISLVILSDKNLVSSNSKGFTLANEYNSSKTLLSSFNSEDSKGTLNFTYFNDVVVLTGSYTYRGLDGDDLYFISNIMTDNSKATIVDSSGINIIQIPDNTFIDSITFTKDSMRIILESSKTITINGADKFNYNLGGNITSGDEGETLSYLDFALAFGVSDVINLTSNESGSSDLFIV